MDSSVIIKFQNFLHFVMTQGFEPIQIHNGVIMVAEEASFIASISIDDPSMTLPFKNVKFSTDMVSKPDRLKVRSGAIFQIAFGHETLPSV